MIPDRTIANKSIQACALVVTEADEQAALAILRANCKQANEAFNARYRPENEEAEEFDEHIDIFYPKSAAVIREARELVEYYQARSAADPHDPVTAALLEDACRTWLVAHAQLEEGSSNLMLRKLGDIAIRDKRNRLLARQRAAAKDLTSDEIQALHDYVFTNAHHRLNAGIRAGDDTQAMIPQLDALMEKLPILEESVLVSREIFRPDNLAASLERLQVGAVITEPAYLSTATHVFTIHPSGAGNILLSIEVPAGTQGCLVDAILHKPDGAPQSADQELLLPRNTRLEITSVEEAREQEDTATFVYARVIIE